MSDVLTMSVSIVRHAGDLWIISQDEDSGLALCFAKANDKRFAGAPPGSIRDFDPTTALGQRPITEVKSSVVVEPWEGGYEITKLGTIWVQQRFVLLMRNSHPKCRWFVPDRALDGPVHAVAHGRTVGAIAGIARSEEDRAALRAKRESLPIGDPK